MRTKKAKKRQIKPDEKYQSILVARLINRSMRDGKKSVAQKQIYKALEECAKLKKMKPVQLLEEVVEKIKPIMEVRSRRVGGASYQVPMSVKTDRAISLAVRWLVIESNKRPNKQYHTYADKLIAEMTDALSNQGGAVGKKISSHKMAESNKAFSHFRW